MSGAGIETSPPSPTWIRNYASGVYSYLERASTLLSYSARFVSPWEPASRAIGAFFASRTSDNAPPHTSCCAIGAASLTVNDNTAYVQPSWCYYGTTLRLPGGGPTDGIEIDVANTGNYVAVNPYDPNPITDTASTEYGGRTIGIAIGAGGESAHAGPPQAAVSAAIFIGNNDSRWGKGIVFGNDSLIAGGEAISMPRGYGVRWWNYEAPANIYVFSSLAAEPGRGLEVYGNPAMELMNGPLTLANGHWTRSRDAAGTGVVNMIVVDNLNNVHVGDNAHPLLLDSGTIHANGNLAVHAQLTLNNGWPLQAVNGAGNAWIRIAAVDGTDTVHLGDQAHTLNLDSGSINANGDLVVGGNLYANGDVILSAQAIASLRIQLGVP